MILAILALLSYGAPGEYYVMIEVFEAKTSATTSHRLNISAKLVGDGAASEGAGLSPIKDYGIKNDGLHQGGVAITDAVEILGSA